MTDVDPAPAVVDRVRDLDPERRATLARLLAERRALGPVARPLGAPTFLSHAQERLWILDQVTDELTAYNAGRLLRFRGPLDTARLEAALSLVVAHHDVLRTHVVSDSGAPRADVADSMAFELEQQDVSTVDDPESAALGLARDLIGRHFDLAKDCLLRALLVRIGPDDHLLALCVHHIASDGTSREILLADLRRNYLLGPDDPEPPRPALQYGDVVAWERAPSRRAHLADQELFWEKELAGAQTVVDLPVDSARPPVQSYAGARIRKTLPEQLSDQVVRLARSRGVTPFIVLLTGFAGLLSRLAGQDDLVVGTPVNRRSIPELDQVMGMMSDTLPLHLDVSGDPTVDDLLVRVKRAVGLAASNRDVPFDRIVELAHPQRSPSRPPLVQVIINDVGARREAAETWGDLTVSPVEVDPGTSQVDLTLAVVGRDDGVDLIWEWCTDLWGTAAIERMSQWYTTLLDAAVADPGRRMSTLPLLGDAERSEVLFGRNRTARPVSEVTLHGLVEARAAEDPDVMAVVASDGTRLTYREFDEAADEIAAGLQALGVRPGDRVALCVERTARLLPGIVGILKTGAAYVPIDPTHPSDRISYVLEDAGVDLAVTSSTTLGSLPQGIPHVLVDGPQPRIGQSGPERVDVDNGALAYVMYTSGSTGRPKGVMVEHGSVVNLLEVMAEHPGLEPGEVMLGVTTTAFDVSVPDLFLPSLTGGTLALASSDVARDPVALARFVEAEHATVMQATPTTWQMLVESGWPGRPDMRIVCGGEGYTAHLTGELVDRVAEVWNYYGPTETTIWSVRARLDRESGDPIPIGRPVANTSCYVLDERGEPVPDGVIGELVIGGFGVAPGYWKRPDLTAERFVEDPFDPDPKARMYRTGDLARWRADGQLIFLGRIDHQVKLRGHRIELGEVEAVLTEAPGVDRAVAIVRTDTPGDSRLVAYVMGDEGLSVAGLQEHLRTRLPLPMLPSAIIVLDSFPLTANNKVDRKALPRPTSDTAAAVSPMGGLEVQLAAIWAELLGVPSIGATDDFFELGGHSLLAARLVARVVSELGIEPALATLFEHPVLSDYASALEGGADVRSMTSAPGHLDEAAHRDHRFPGCLVVPTSFAQEQMWIVDRLERGQGISNLPVARKLTGRVDTAALGAALDALVARHPALRTGLVEVDGVLQQVVHPSGHVPVVVDDLSGAGDPWTAAIALATGDALAPFDVEHPPLARARLILAGADDTSGDDQALFCLTVHHSMADATSVFLLIEQLRHEYARIVGAGDVVVPEPPTRTYADFAEWQRKPEQLARIESDLDYWKTTLAGAPQAIDLPFDRARPLIPTHRGGRVVRPLDPRLALALRQLSAESSTTVFMTVLALWASTLALHGRHEEVVVGVPASGRPGDEFDDVVGLFLNILPVRVGVAAGSTFDDILEGARDALVGAMAHQEASFDRIVDALGASRRHSTHPVFQVSANMYTEPPAELPFGDALVHPTAVDWGWSRFGDLALMVAERAGTFDLLVEFNRDVFDESTVDRLVTGLEHLLHAATDDPDLVLTGGMLAGSDGADELIPTRGAVDPTTGQQVRIHELVSQRAALDPTATAVEFGDWRSSYVELESASNQLAHRLIGLGVTPGSLVGICLERSPDLPVALLAVLKAGAAFVPLDPGAPDERLTFMVADGGVEVVITTQALGGRLGGDDLQLVLLDTERAALDGLPTGLPEIAVEESDLAYVIYTSGSTGVPKGVAVEHRGVTNLTDVVADVFRIDATSRVLQFASFAFDASVTELLVPLAVGATVVLAPSAVTTSGLELLELLQSAQVSVATLPPSLLAALPDTDLPHLLTLCSAGEACPSEVVRRWGRGRRFLNGYGPTEATVAISYAVFDDGLPADSPSVPLGEPIANVYAYVVDPAGLRVPVGVPGELWVGGAGVARGYLGRPELTAERFVPDPFQPGGRIFKTGDRVRWRPDGQLEFLGRLDNQVKLRGFRIELGEIEVVLASHPSVRDVAVLVREDVPGNQRLVAYVVSDSEAIDSVDQFRSWARRHLPEYMVPSAVVLIDALPLTLNGKVDRSALPAPERDVVPSGDGAEAKEASPIEAVVRDVWCELLGLADLGLDEDLFDVGVDSLMATRAAARLRTEFGVDLAIPTIFETPTVSGIALAVLVALADTDEPLYEDPGAS